MRKTGKYLIGLAGAVTLVLALGGSAEAHSRFFFGFTLVPPLPPPVAVYPAPPVYVAPPGPPVGYYYDRGVYYDRHFDPYTGRYYLVPRLYGPHYRHYPRVYGPYGY